MKNIINPSNIDYTKQPLFLGEGLNIQRYDSFKYKKLFDLFNQQLSFFWRPEEVSLIKDKSDYLTLTENEKNIFTKNLSYQILLDSVQARAIPFLSQLSSSPEFEACANAWQFFEQIHSYSYTYIIKNIYPTTSEVFDPIMDNEYILNRATSVTKYYNDLINNINASDKEGLKEKIYLTLVSVNILEGIRFYVSFACSFAFAENKKMEGNAKIISFINRDENLHLAITQNLLKYLKNEKDEGFQEVIKKCEPIVYKMYEDAAKEEIEWAEYLFKDGSMLGLNQDILTLYMKWLTNKRMTSIGLNPIFGKIDNPIGWIKSWTESKDVQQAPQEVELSSYRISSFKQDIDSLNLKKFKI